MSIIVPKPIEHLKKQSIQIPETLLQEIQAYCDTFQIADVNDFLCQAGQYVLKTDRDWAKASKEKATADTV